MKTKLLAAGAMLAFSSVLSACGASSTPIATTAAPAGATDTTAPAAGAANTPMASTPGGGSSNANGRKVVVSSKAFTEETLVGEMYAEMLENAGIPVDRKLNLGTEAVAQAALIKGGSSGGIDLYPEYTGTGLLAILKADPISDPQQAYDAVKKQYKEKFNFVWLDKAPMNDTQAIATTKEVSDKYGLKSLADLCAKSDSLTLAAAAEFKGRADGLPGLQKVYGGCNFKDIKIVESNLRYKALVNKDVDVTVAYGTDGAIAGNSLVLLADPKNYGPPDNVAPVV
ncbi:MAG: hypothetical protein M3014_06455, partial [Chloroflexota bacterium]|nr:hypothetical protein [Chloroflexota bacterium]